MVCCFGLFCAPSFTCFSLRLRDTLQSPNVQPTRASRASAWASFVGAMANDLVQIGTCGVKPSNFLPSDRSSLASLLKTVHDDLTMFQVTRQVVETISNHFNPFHPCVVLKVGLPKITSDALPRSPGAAKRGHCHLTPFDTLIS